MEKTMLKAIKYLYKYVYKGHDRVAFSISYNNEEYLIDVIKQFRDARWVSAQEAMWRIFEFNLNEMFPYVINLQLHLPNKQMIWKLKEAIGRVNSTNPSEGERFYLRLLLNHVRGPTSFEHLLCVDDIRCSTFKEAAQKQGLLKSDNAISECLEDSTGFNMPIIVRKLFAMILVYCEPGDVKKLWDYHFEALSEDIQKRTGGSEYHTMETIRSVNSFLQSMGKSVKDYDLSQIKDIFNQFNGNHPREIVDEYSIKVPSEDYDAKNNLNPEQYNAYNVILKQINANQSGIYFIDGPGGTRKTYLYRALLVTKRSKNEIALGNNDIKNSSCNNTRRPNSTF
ncbi:uncharacterized protein LOC122659313 [Telopea speciosissima]|uniref:uncharacterized protein LOC122659313 n=1 Tax=Telopea speciosissima TaxID=54955 RepID=UPI001CC4C548|nr:uncharacterized protein LOC122659313 [Telopea speciosissima]